MSRKNKGMQTGRNNTLGPSSANTSNKIVQYREEMYMGIIPSPEMMKSYGDLDPALPMILVNMAKDEGEHRRAMDRHIVKHNYRTEYTRTIAAVLCLLIISATGVWFMLEGNATSGASVLCTCIVGAMAVIVTRKRGKDQAAK